MSGSQQWAKPAVGCPLDGRVRAHWWRTHPQTDAPTLPVPAYPGPRHHERARGQARIWASDAATAELRGTAKSKLAVGWVRPPVVMMGRYSEVDQRLCQAVARLLSLHQGREQVVARTQPTLSEQPSEVAFEQPEIGDRARDIQDTPRGNSERQGPADQNMNAAAVFRLEDPRRREPRLPSRPLPRTPWSPHARWQDRGCSLYSDPPSRRCGQ